MLYFFIFFRRLYSGYPNIYYRAKKYKQIGSFLFFMIVMKEKVLMEKQFFYMQKIQQVGEELILMAPNTILTEK